MDFGKHYRLLDNIDISNLIGVVDNLTDRQWKFNTCRQDRFNVHKQTKSIVLRFCEVDSLNFIHYKRDFPQLDILEPILEHIASFYEIGGFLRIVIVSLPPGASVDRHVDLGAMYDYAHRIHIPIHTNDNVYFHMAEPFEGGTLEDVRIPFNVGDIVEINNRWLHEVDNRSDKERIHLIVDYMTDADKVKIRKEYGSKLK